MKEKNVIQIIMGCQGGGGTLFLSSYVGSGPASTVHQKISAISKGGVETRIQTVHRQNRSPTHILKTVHRHN